MVCYDVVRSSVEPASKRIVFIIPGVNSNLHDHHINATVKKANSQGYHCVVVNPVRPDFKQCVNDLEVIDYSRVEPIAESIDAIRQMFGKDCQIFAVGFSLGSNHLLRHLGAHKNCKDICGIQAAMSISSAFDIRATCCLIQDRLFGVYDKFMLYQLQETFSTAHFKATS